MVKKTEENLIAKSINEAFVAAQKLIGHARKSSTNPHFKSKYADLKECFNACSDILNNHGIHITQPTVQEGDMLVVRTILTHTSGETIQDFGIPLAGWQSAKNPMQALGSAISYGRRYSLCSLIGITPAEDDGQSLTQDVQQRISNKQQSEIVLLLEHRDVNRDAFMKYFGINDVYEMTADKFASAKKQLEAKPLKGVE